jgi:DNA-directed RNA polymerase specialized sigma24 family protein
MPVTPHALNGLLLGFIRRYEEAAGQFKKVASPIIRGLARRFGPDLPADLVDDVVSETYVILLGRSGRGFDAARGSAREFLFGIVGNAVKNVRASNRPPGLPTRPRKDKQELIVAPVIPFDELLHSGTRRLLPDIRQIEAHIDARALLGTVASVLAAALIAIHVRGENASSVSRRLGVSRFQINRALQRIHRAAQPPGRSAAA